ncbi:MAG TPA: ABC transporter permease [Methylomirabilota bacterium]|nr:ABC transporter permease [Methylomirabilota bacterium]
MFFQTIKIALKALLLNKARTFLTMLGIVIGIAAVIILISAGSGAQSLILDQVKGIGSNFLFIIPGGSGKSQFSAPAQASGTVVTSLTDQDVKSLRNKDLASDIEYVSPEVRGQFVVSFGTTDEQASVAGEDENFYIVRNMTLSEGNWYTKAEVDGFTQVAILGSKLKEDLFGSQDPIGQIVKIKQLSFRVIGVLELKGVGPGGVDQDSQVIVPVSTAQKILLGIDYYSLIQVQVKDVANLPTTQEDIAKILRNNHRITDPNKDDFTIRNQQDAVSLISTITSALTLFLAAIAGISLVVGGIGIMNIMLVSVTERTREIGLRKAIGATRRNILSQFLIEAILLTSLGGVIGVVIGYAGSIGIAKIGNWTPTVPIYGILLAVGVSAVFGLVFGIYPANKASKLNPIEALRYE